ncbi:hypothetical protein FG381_11835 [Sutterella faecalis]|uniref:Transposase n=2 Tax=Sutterella TaxID=40544 RepID=A0ABX5VLY1_9BURK|nr:hypothetical protein [Sutterella faecalis]QDA55564.1 hypothetical protein FG381_11835 [Sutterella faecalis]
MDFTEQELLIDRLDNWGRVYGERRPPGRRSSLLGVLREVGYQQEVPQEPAQPRTDMADAAVVNAAWVAMRQSREKVFLRDTFMHPGRPRGCVCRGIGLKEHHYPDMLARSLNAIAAQLKIGYTVANN